MRGRTPNNYNFYPHLCYGVNKGDHKGIANIIEAVKAAEMMGMFDEKNLCFYEEWAWERFKEKHIEKNPKLRASTCAVTTYGEEVMKL